MWVARYILVLICFYVLYAFLAEVCFHLLHIGTFWRGGDDQKRVAFTFDDGPDPEYTPQLLALLKAHGVRATFFLVADRARRYPSLVRAMVDDGHEVASHGMHHRHAWLLDPLTTWREIRRSKQILEELTGKPVRFYRPPWGAFNLASRWACRRLGLTPVLWSARAVDWKPGSYAAAVARRLLSGLEPGAILLCHDAGGAPGAPRHTLAALPEVLDRLRKLDYECVTVSELFGTGVVRSTVRMTSGYPWPRRALIRVWALVEWGFTVVHHIRSIGAMFRVSRNRWTYGPRVDASGRTLVADGVPALDLHFHNDMLISLSSTHDNRALVRGLRMVRLGLADLARLITYHPDYEDIQVIMAITLINRGIESLGFHVEDLPDTPKMRRTERYLQFLMGLYHPDGFRRLREGRRDLRAKLVWMTREEVLQQYGQERARGKA